MRSRKFDVFADVVTEIKGGVMACRSFTFDMCIHGETLIFLGRQGGKDVLKYKMKFDLAE